MAGSRASDGSAAFSTGQGWLGLVGFTRERLRLAFLRLGFSSCLKSSEGLAPLSRWTRRYARPFQPTSFSRSFEMGGSEGASSLPRLMRAHEPRVGPDISAPTAGKYRPLLRPNAFRAYFFTDGRQPFVPAASATPACFELSFGSPFFRGKTAVRRRFKSAPPSSDGENITRT